MIILIIDWDASRHWIARVLREADFTVMEAEGGQVGLDSALNSSPNLIIVGEGIPNVEDGELLPALRSITGVPIISLGTGSSYALFESLTLGADLYLNPTVGVKELLAYIKALLRRYRMVIESASNKSNSGEAI